MKQHSQQGLTLLEVLIALFILSLSLTAIIKTTGENIRSTRYLQEKTHASWVGLHCLNQAHLRLQSLPAEPALLDGQETVFGEKYLWQGFKRVTGNHKIEELHVKVYHEPDHRLVKELTSYDYAD